MKPFFSANINSVHSIRLLIFVVYIYYYLFIYSRIKFDFQTDGTFNPILLFECELYWKHRCLPNAYFPFDAFGNRYVKLDSLKHSDEIEFETNTSLFILFSRITMPICVHFVEQMKVDVLVLELLHNVG